MVTLKELHQKYKVPHLKALQFGIWGKTINYLSLPIIKVLMYTSVTPNQITVFWTILGVISCLFFVPGTYIAGIIGALLLNLTWIVDSCDGTLARAKKIFSDQGDYMESIGHWIIDSALMACIAFGVYSRFGNPLSFALGFAASTSILLLNLLSREKINLFVRNGIYKKFEMITAHSDNKGKNDFRISKMQRVFAKVISYYRLDFFCAVLLVLSLFDLIYLFLIFYGFTFPLIAISLYWYETRRGFGWVHEFMREKGMMK